MTLTSLASPRHAVSMACVLILGGCAVVGGDDPDQAQRDAWRKAVDEANSAFVEVEVEGTLKTGSTPYTAVTVVVESRDLDASDIRDVVEAIDDSTEEANRGHMIEAGFVVLDPDSASGYDLLYLDDLADDDIVNNSGSVLRLFAGEESWR